MTPMLIVVPFWRGDLPQAWDLLRIITGLQKVHVGPQAHVLLVCRQDAMHDRDMIKLVMAKFNTFTFISRSAMKGWPDGPNGMFGSAMIHVANNGKNKYEVVYWMEPDAIPLVPDWFNDLLGAWRARPPGTLVVGNRGDANGNGTGDHITGCAMYAPNIARSVLSKITHTSGMAWDWIHREDIVKHGQHTHLIENYYKATNCSEEQFEAFISNGRKIVHGFKDRSLVSHVAKKYGIKI